MPGDIVSLQMHFKLIWKGRFSYLQNLIKMSEVLMQLSLQNEKIAFRTTLIDFTS